MAENRKCFTFIWKIKNFSSCLSNKEVSFMHTMSGTNWRVLLYPDSYTFKNCVACYIQRCDLGPHKFELNLELSFLAGDESVLKSEVLLKKVCHKGPDTIIKLGVERDKVFLLEKEFFIPDDIFTISFKMWNSLESNSQLIKCFAETLIRTHRKFFVGSIEKFSFIKAKKRYTFCNNSSSTEISMSLTISENGLVEVEIKSLESINYSKCEIFILDEFKNKVKSGQGEFYNTKSICIPLTVTKDYLIKNNKFFLPKDELIIHCEVIGPEGEAINEVKYVFDCQDAHEVISNTKITDVSSQEHHIENLEILKDDLISLFSEGNLSDTKLKTATETFPAHMAILSARSPVFKSMFATDMKEKTNKCVEIDDLDADTVRRMLLFMYSATLDDLEYENAKSLYFAADKYNIVPLRNRCSSFLKQNLLFSNCCDILLLANKHLDKDLKDAVQDYIAENDEAVLNSDEWRNLEKNNSQLIVEVFRFIYMKNRRN